MSLGTCIACLGQIDQRLKDELSRLRNEGDPYLGMVDCAKRIVEEEGYKTLYRAWWLTLLGGLFGAFA